MYKLLYLQFCFVYPNIMQWIFPPHETQHTHTQKQAPGTNPLTHQCICQHHGPGSPPQSSSVLGSVVRGLCRLPLGNVCQACNCPKQSQIIQIKQHRSGQIIFQHLRCQTNIAGFNESYTITSITHETIQLQVCTHSVICNQCKHDISRHHTEPLSIYP